MADNSNGMFEPNQVTYMGNGRVAISYDGTKGKMDSSFPSQGQPRPAHLGSQSSIPGKEDDYLPYTNYKQPL